MTQVTAPNGAITKYEYDALARRTSETSPERGRLAYHYDTANRLLSHTDARSITTTYAYDNLDRLLQKQYPTASESVTYTYDSCTNGIGRLCSRVDESGTYNFAYDVYANILQRDYTHSTSGNVDTTYRTAWTYDAGNQVTQMTYPSGHTVDYTRDGLRRTSAINRSTAGDNPTKTTLLSAITYRADGQLSARTFGNGLIDTRTYDQQSRLTKQTLGNANTTLDTRDYHYDAVGNIIQQILNNTQANNGNSNDEATTYAYDQLHRLTQQTSTTLNQQFTYDASGSRLTRGIPSDTPTPTTYRYATDSHRLLDSEDPTTNSSVSADFTLHYNDANRLAKLSKDSNDTQYVYNDNGLRKTKTTANGTTTVYHYDLDGRLLSETDTNSKLQRQYLWHDAEPIVQINAPKTTEQTEQLVYLHADHLMTPRLGTNPEQIIVWHWSGDAFGSDSPNIDTTEVNLRFPGQYYDAESGLHYNWNRYYDPTTGRYITSDPIGLLGGINTYGYVHQNAVRYMDPLGLYMAGLPTSGLFNMPGGVFKHVFGPTVKKLRAASAKVKNCIGCEVECTYDFIVGQIPEEIFLMALEKTSKRLLSEIVFKTGKYIVKKALIWDTVYDAAQTAYCVVECQETKGCC